MMHSKQVLGFLLLSGAAQAVRPSLQARRLQERDDEDINNPCPVIDGINYCDPMQPIAEKRQACTITNGEVVCSDGAPHGNLEQSKRTDLQPDENGCYLLNGGLLCPDAIGSLGKRQDCLLEGGQEVCVDIASEVSKRQAATCGQIDGQQICLPAGWASASGGPDPEINLPVSKRNCVGFLGQQWCTTDNPTQDPSIIKRAGTGGCLALAGNEFCGPIREDKHTVDLPVVCKELSGGHTACLPKAESSAVKRQAIDCVPGLGGPLCNDPSSLPDKREDEFECIMGSGLSICPPAPKTALKRDGKTTANACPAGYQYRDDGESSPHCIALVQERTPILPEGCAFIDGRQVCPVLDRRATACPPGTVASSTVGSSFAPVCLPLEPNEIQQKRQDAGFPIFCGPDEVPLDNGSPDAGCIKKSGVEKRDGCPPGTFASSTVGTGSFAPVCLPITKRDCPPGTWAPAAGFTGGLPGACIPIEE